MEEIGKPLTKETMTGEIEMQLESGEIDPVVSLEAPCLPAALAHRHELRPAAAEPKGRSSRQRRES
jgi:hypothetical protein